jgi:plastocyanin
MLRATACLASVLALAVAGCGSDSKSDKSSDSGGSSGGGGGYGDQSKPKSGGSGGAKAGTSVMMKNIKFVPMDVTVKKGDTVVWTNNDSVTHNVTKEKGPGPDFKSSNLDGGDTYKYKFTAPGKYDYVCTIHPNQAGTVTVK